MRIAVDFKHFPASVEDRVDHVSEFQLSDPKKVRFATALIRIAPCKNRHFCYDPSTVTAGYSDPGKVRRHEIIEARPPP